MAGFDLFIENPPDGALSTSNYAFGLGVNGKSTNTSRVTAARPLPDLKDNWVFLAVAYDGTKSDTNVRFYVGTQDAAPENVGEGYTELDGGAMPDKMGELQIGHTSATQEDRSPPALIDDVRIYDDLLTPGEIKEIWAQNR
jgi:hypothetical protein